MNQKEHVNTPSGQNGIIN